VVTIFDLLETFVTVVESGSLSEAAKKLHANQPNLTVRIQKLEKELGVNLFDREGKKLVVNPIGRKMYKQTKSLLNMYADIRGEIELYKQPNFGHIRIGGGFQILLTTMAQFLLKFSEEFPKVTYEINEIGPSYEIYRLVDLYEIDFGFVDTKHSYENIESVDLGLDTTTVLVVPKNSEYAQLNEINIEDLQKLQFITFKKGTKIMNYIEDELEQKGVSLKVRMEIDHIELIIKMVEMGMGVSLLPISGGSHILLDKEVKILHVNGLAFTPKPLYFIYRKNRFYPSSFLHFISELKTYFNFK
jgi:DNA-binding transcriptional LysR family regulator